MTRHMQDRNNRPGLFSFVTGWATTHVAATCAILIIVDVWMSTSTEFDISPGVESLIFAGIFASLQFLWLRQSWRITLWGWLPFALLGVVVGETVFEIFAANVEYPFPPKLWSHSPNRMPQPEHIMQLKYTLYNAFRFFLVWSIPLVFQWLTLRKRFRQHGLWLLAAVAHAPLTFVITENGGILVQALKLFDQLTALSLIRDAQPLGSIAYLLDTATPTMVMGLALYWLLTLGEKIKTDQIRAHQR